MENGTNSEIEFYTLNLLLHGDRNVESICINTDGTFNGVSIIAIKKDNEENGTMIDVLSGIEIPFRKRAFEPGLTYTSKRKSKLLELDITRYICSLANKGKTNPLNEYINQMKYFVKKEEEHYAEYIRCYDIITEYMFNSNTNEESSEITHGNKWFIKF